MLSIAKGKLDQLLKNIIEANIKRSTVDNYKQVAKDYYGSATLIEKSGNVDFFHPLLSLIIIATENLLKYILLEYEEVDLDEIKKLPFHNIEALYEKLSENKRKEINECYIEGLIDGKIEIKDQNIEYLLHKINKTYNEVRYSPYEAPGKNEIEDAPATYNAILFDLYIYLQKVYKLVP